MAPPDDQLYCRLAIYNTADEFANNIVSLFVIFTIPYLVSFVKFRHVPYFLVHRGLKSMAYCAM